MIARHKTQGKYATAGLNSINQAETNQQTQDFQSEIFVRIFINFHLIVLLQQFPS